MTQSTTIVLTDTNQSIKISTYSTLDSALDITVHAKPEPTMSIDTTTTPQLPIIYNPQYHYSNYSALAGHWVEGNNG